MTEAVRVFTAMKQDIILGGIQPGSSVSEAELSSRYETGRTPVREACRRLQEESLVQITPYRGITITPLTIEEYRNLQEAQFVIEPAIAALAAERASPVRIRKIESLAEYEYYPDVPTSYSTFLDRNRQFHGEIALASGNSIFQQTVSNLHARLMRYFYLVISFDSYGRQLVEEHRSIARAIKRRDPELSRKAAADHIQRTIARSAKLSIAALNATEEIVDGEPSLSRLRGSSS